MAWFMERAGARGADDAVGGGCCAGFETAPTAATGR